MTKKSDNKVDTGQQADMGIRHSVMNRGNDDEKFEYAYKGMTIDFNNVISKCADICPNCTEEQCTNTQENVLSIFADSKIKYNLTDREYLESVMIAFDKLIGHPAQPVNIVASDNMLNAERSFNVDPDQAMRKAMGIYIERYGDPYVVANKEMKFAGTHGFDKIVEILLNEVGVSYKEMIVICLNYIHALTELISQLSKK